MRRLTEFILILAAFLLQSTFFKFFSLGNVSPNLVLMLTAFFAFMCGKEDGMFAGLAAGLLTDILYGNGIIGIYTLIYVWIGYVCGAFHRIFFPEDVVLPIILTTFSDIFCGFITYVLMFLLRTRLDVLWYILHIILPEAVYTLVMTILLFKPVLFIIQRLEVSSDRGL